MKLQFDFTAQAGKHFGQIIPLDDAVLALANPVDVWLSPNIGANLTLVAGRVSEWKGRRNARVLGQTNAARRPLPENGLLRMSSDLQAPASQLDLTGTPIGSRTAITIAAHGRIHPEQINVDNQYFWGTSSANALFRLAYRYTNSTRYLRIQIGTTALSLDVPLAAEWSGSIGAVAVLSGGTLTLYLSNGNSNSITLSGPIDLQTFSVGNAVANAGGGLRGYNGNFGIWARAVTPEERALLLRWVT